MTNLDNLLILQKVDVGDGVLLQDYLTGEFLLSKEDDIIREKPGAFRRGINALTALSFIFGAGAAYKFFSGNASVLAAEEQKDWGIYADGEKPLHSKEVLVFMEKGGDWYKIPVISPGDSIDLRDHLKFTKAVKYGTLDGAIYNILKDGIVSREETKNLAPGVYSGWIQTEDKENAVRVNIAVIDSRDSLERLAKIHGLSAEKYNNLEQMLGDIEENVGELISKRLSAEEFQKEINSLKQKLQDYQELKDRTIFAYTVNVAWVYGSEKVADKTHNRNDFGTNTMVLDLSNDVILNYLLNEGYQLSDLKGKVIDFGIDGHIKLVNYLKENWSLIRKTENIKYDFRTKFYLTELNI